MFVCWFIPWTWYIVCVSVCVYVYVYSVDYLTRNDVRDRVFLFVVWHPNLIWCSYNFTSLLLASSIDWKCFLQTSWAKKLRSKLFIIGLQHEIIPFNRISHIQKGCPIMPEPKIYIAFAPPWHQIKSKTGRTIYLLLYPYTWQ